MARQRPGPLALAPVDLEGGAFANPLLITVAAYLAVHDPDRSVPAFRAALLGELAGHEDAYWQATARAARLPAGSEKLRARTVALATLAGADSEHEGAQLLGLLPELEDAAANAGTSWPGWSADSIRVRWWNPVEPDLLGEYLVARHLTDMKGVLAGVLRRDNPSALAQPLDVYPRALVDHPRLADALTVVLDENLVEVCEAAIAQATSQPDIRLLLGVSTVAAALTRPCRPTVPPDRFGTPSLDGPTDRLVLSWRVPALLFAVGLIAQAAAMYTAFLRWLAVVCGSRDVGDRRPP